jgi:putative DNA primase/helicase
MEAPAESTTAPAGIRGCGEDEIGSSIGNSRHTVSTSTPQAQSDLLAALAAARDRLGRGVDLIAQALDLRAMLFWQMELAHARSRRRLEAGRRGAPEEVAMNEKEKRAQAAALADKYVTKDGKQPSNVVPLPTATAGVEHAPPTTGAPNLEETVAALAKLTPLEFDQVYKGEAERLGVRPATLDKAVKDIRRAVALGGDRVDADFLRDPDPWPDPVDGADLADKIRDVAASHVDLPEGGADTIALWVLFDHAHDYFTISPILEVTSPTPECGKTTVLRLLSKMSTRPLSASNITGAAVFRAVDMWKPTVLVDEADTYLRDSDDLRGILNSGHDRSSAFVVRTVGDNHEPKQFNTWAPKVIAMIGKLPPTLASRGIHIKLKRMLPGAKLTPLRVTQHLTDLQCKCIRWAMDHADGLIGADPKMPGSLYGRAADNWRPLLAIADLIGGEWPKRARAVAVIASGRSDDLASIQILHDIAAIFGQRGVDKLSSEEIIHELSEMEGRPWPEWGNAQKSITKNQLAKLLEPHRIVPGTIRLPSGKTPKGYHLRAFDDALARYPLTCSQDATTPQPLQDKGLRVFQNATPKSDVAFQKDGKALRGNGCGVVAIPEPQSGGESDNDAFASLKDPSLKLRRGGPDE